MISEGTNTIFRGRCLSPGLADGLLVINGSRDDTHHRCEPEAVGAAISQQQVDSEHGSFDAAVETISSDLTDLAAKVGREISIPLGEVFDAHRMIANDHSLRCEIQDEITHNLINAGAAVRVVFQRWEERFRLMESSIARSKSDDLQDVANRLQCLLSGVVHQPLADLPPGCILVMTRLLPSDTVVLAARMPAAIILEHGNHGSHAALFVRSMGIPCIVCQTSLRQYAQADMAIRALVDADAGTITVDPDESLIRQFEYRRHAVALRQQHALQQADRPALTFDGSRVLVMANIGNAEDAVRAVQNGADGIGLFRTEQLYLGRTTPPDLTELTEAMHRVLAPVKGLPICVRLLDIGADKQLPFLECLHESNPALGRRGIRLLRAYPHLLETGLRAMVNLNKEFPLSILVPLVTLPADLSAVTTMLADICADQGCTPPPVGAMIETPAAALSITALKAHIDFISFGTNDLTQYCFAADRDSSVVDDYFMDSHAAILRLLHLTREAAPELPATICGELAGSDRHIGDLVDLGIRCFSVAPTLIARVKETIRTLRPSAQAVEVCHESPTRSRHQPARQ